MKKNRAESAHIFAFWYPSLSDDLRINNREMNITDKELIARMRTVLRLRIGESCILFDRAMHSECTVQAIDAKAIRVTCTINKKNLLHTPVITALLPLLKKDDLSTAVADLTAIGISQIQLITTDTVQRQKIEAAELARLERVIIAAAEQSKQFAVPQLLPPISLPEALKKNKHILCGDPDGQPYAIVLTQLPPHEKAYAVLVGPEAAFSSAEAALLREHTVISCALTPTVLKSQLAITILAVTVRSWYYKNNQ